MKLRLLLVSLFFIYGSIFLKANPSQVQKPSIIIENLFASNISGDGNINLDKQFLARRGGGSRSFGGSRRSSRSSSRSSRSTSRSRSSRSSKATKAERAKTPSFGGSRMTSQAAQKKYGTPRKTSTMTGKNANGQPVTYQVNSYGGFGSSLMTGYMMGSLGWMVIPSLLYSRPAYVTNPDGTIGVYPPTFSFGRLLFFLIILFAIIWVVRSVRRAMRNASGGGGSQSSFG